MKHITYTLLVLGLLVFGGCAESLSVFEPEGREGDEVTVRFSATLPDYATVHTRDNEGVNDMYLLVFDNNGIFIARRQATLTNQTQTGGTFTATLPSSADQRTVHFISNYDWTGFDDNALLGSNEAAVVGLMSTQNATFWSRVALSGGISATSFNGPAVELLRNQAKISVTNAASNFTYAGFAIHNAPDKGTVAPFKAAGGFAEGIISEAAGMALVSAQETDLSTTEKLLFERKNALASNITTVIVKGTYQGNSYYYKIDLIDANKNRYDLQRNYHYAVTIKTVTRAGYVNFADALAGASHNNTALDPIIEKYPMISDGTSKLQVEKTLVILTRPNQTFSVWAKYFPDINSETVNNAGVTAAIQSGNEALNAGSLGFNPSTGIISATGLGTLPNEPAEARIVVAKGDLARTIRVVLREPFTFDPVTINNTNPGIVVNGQSQDAFLRFNIPIDFPTDLFPLPINIYAQGLYPAASGLEMVVEGGVIRYVYRATETGQQTLHFKTNKSNNAENVTLKADYFTDGVVAYHTNNIIISGTIEYYENYRDWGSWNQRWSSLPQNATVSISGITGHVWERPSNGNYSLTIPYTAANPSITFTYSYTVPYGFGNSRDFMTTQTRTLNELKSNSSLRLE